MALQCSISIEEAGVLRPSLTLANGTAIVTWAKFRD
jgi:hypothetical protein